MARPATNAEYRWIEVTPRAAFSGRDGAGALVYNERLWLIGGWNPADKKTNPIHSNCNNEVWNSTDGVNWSLVKANTHVDAAFDPAADWEARHTAGYVVFQNKIWIVGGDPLLGHYQFDVWNSTDGLAWHWVNRGNPVPWGPRVLHYTFVFQDLIWVLGGQTLPQFAPAEEIFYADAWNSKDGIHWNKVALKNTIAAGRGLIGGSTVFQDRVWLLGGGRYQTPQQPQYRYFNDVWSSADGLTWELHLDHAPWVARVYHDVAVFDGRLWVMEGVGSDGKNTNDVWYSSDGVRWHELPATPWEERHAASVFVFKDALYLACGNHMGRDVWRLVRK